MASRSRWVRRTFSGIGACEDGRVMVRLLCRGCGLQTAHCKPADQHRQLASAIGRQLPPGHLLARLARAHDEPRSSARAPVAPRCRAAAASSTGMTLQGFRWGWLEHLVGKLKRFKRVALRCEKTNRNFGSFVAFALGLIIVKSVHAG